MRKRKRLAAIVLALCLAVLTAVPASAVSLQEQYYLQTLIPATPKITASHPVKLIVSIQGIPPTRFELSGRVGVDSTISDGEMLTALKQALTSVTEYKELQNPTDDKVLIRDLSVSVETMTKEDMARIKNNLLSILGVDKMADLLSEKLPSFSNQDIADYAKGVVEEGKLMPDLMPTSPNALLSGAIVNGIKISITEFQRDLQKYRDIVTLSQARARIRTYYARVDELVRELLSDKGNWAIVIDGQDTEPFNYYGVDECTQILTADIKLTKQDGSTGNITGSYTGDFKLRLDCDLLPFDEGYAKLRCSTANGNVPGMPSIGGGVNSWHITANEGKTSEMYYVMEAESYTVNLSLPEGTNKAFLELPLSVEPLFITDYICQVDRIVELQAKAEEIIGLWNIEVIVDDYDSVLHDVWKLTTSQGTTSGDLSESGTVDVDFTPYMRMTLTVDMLG